MKKRFKDFQSGTYVQQNQYKSFLPSKINYSWVWDDEQLNVLLEKATRALGGLSALTEFVPDVDIFIRMHIVKEASTSSKIEGTKTNIDDAIMSEEEVAPEKKDDWKEVDNYVKAISYGIDEMDRLPLCNRLLLGVHEKLLDSVRGKNKLPGEFRRSQNWIGGSSLSDASFIPPHHNDLNELLTDLELFFHNEKIQVPNLIRAAISHYQFETIHPFLDGNGRVGRLLIVLYFVDKGLLNKPSLYLSDFFERNRNSYYDALTKVRNNNDISHWCRFFLKGVYESAQSSKKTFNEVLSLKASVDKKILKLGSRAQYGEKLLKHLYQKPSVTIRDVEKVCGINYKPANSLVSTLVEMNILQEITGNQRNRNFVFKDYVVLFSREA